MPQINLSTVCTRALFTLALTTTLSLAACQGPSKSGAPQAAQENAVTHAVTQSDLDALNSTTPLAEGQVEMWVNGMSCPLCITSVDILLERTKGIEGTPRVDLASGKIYTNLAGKTRPSPADLRNVVSNAGFTLVKLVQR
jgi:hypothetical protein